MTASSISNVSSIDDASMRVFKGIGGQMTVIHELALKLGDVKQVLYVHHEHFVYMLFHNVGADPVVSFENALNKARNSQGVATYFVCVKMYDNNFFLNPVCVADLVRRWRQKPELESLSQFAAALTSRAGFGVGNL